MALYIKRLSIFLIALVLATSAKSAEFNFKELLKLIQGSRVGMSIDQFIAELPRDYKDYYTLLYKSDSLQFASPMNPRVILFGPSASLVMAFSCTKEDCEKAGANPHMDLRFDSIEIIRFNSDTSEFEFYELSFFNNKKPELSEKNPLLCQSCHGGENPRPNWEHYISWPKAYGETEFGFLGEKEREERLIEFEREKQSKKRYRQLGGFLEQLNDSLFAPDHSRKAFAKAKPNSFFSQLIGIHNYQRIMGEMKSAGEFYQLIAVGLMGGCAPDRILSMIPGYDDFKSAFLELIKRARLEDYESYLTDLSFGMHSHYNGQIMKVALLFDFLGLDTRKWPMNERFGLHNSFVQPKNAADGALAGFYFADPGLIGKFIEITHDDNYRGYYGPNGSSTSSMCYDLDKALLKLFDELQSSGELLPLNRENSKWMELVY